MVKRSVIGTVVAHHLSDPPDILERVGVGKYKAIVPTGPTQFRKSRIQYAVVVGLQVIQVVLNQRFGRRDIGIDISSPVF